MVRRRLGVLLVCAGAAVGWISGCRAVLGIEEIEESTHPNAALDAAASDAVSGEPGSDSGNDTGASVTECAVGEGCPQCCREAYQTELKNLETESRAAGCVCGTKCKTECATDTCASPPSASPPSPTCGFCLDTTLPGKTSPPDAKCDKGLAACIAKDARCEAAARCLSGCFK